MEDRRGHTRSIPDDKLDCILTADGIERQATILDHSPGGLKILLEGEPLPVDTVLKVDSVALELHKTAKIVWNKTSGDISLTGLHFI